MLTQYTYIKPRYQFGKQCHFLHTKNIAEVNIWPEPELMNDYVHRTHCHKYTQGSVQHAAHEAQATTRIIANTGVLHEEGGWSKDVNARDEEVVHRFRRRVEKSDAWATCMRKLLKSMERHIVQNSAVNIYQNYFDDLIPTAMAKEYDIRVTNLYEDPQSKVRPIRNISWSANGSNRLAAAYGFLEFDEHPTDVSPYSYVWDIENPNKALNTLKSPSPLMSVEFNSRDPVMLVSGLLTGQVCCWDIRASEKPVFTSRPYTSHRQPVTQTLWIPSKTNKDFFSSSSDGTVLWWDIRQEKGPIETLVMDLQNPSGASFLQAVGVTALQYESTMSSRFLAGTENGIVLSVNRRGQNPVEKLATRFECCTGPVIAIDRNPTYTKSFLTIGDWCAKVWADDTKEGYFLNACKHVHLSGGCWSRTRSSVFYTITSDGLLHAYDILAGVKTPVTSIRVSRNSLTAINSREDGELLAVGSSTGQIYLLECSQDLKAFSKDERAALSNYLDKCSRFEKALDSRMKEVRFLQASSLEDPVPHAQETKTKAKKKESKEKKKDRPVSIVKERRDSRKRSKVPKPKGKSSVRSSSPRLAQVEINYFEKIEQESKKFEPLDEADVESAQPILLAKIAAMAPKEEEADAEKDDVKRHKSIYTIKSRRRMIKASRRSSKVSHEQLPVADELTATMDGGKKQRPSKILKKSCAKAVCKPAICCADMEVKRKSKVTKTTVKEAEPWKIVPERSFVAENKWFRTLSDYVAVIPSPPLALRRKILAMKSAPPNILRGELEEAKKELRAWQEKAIARKLSTWAIERKLEQRAEELIGSKQDAISETKSEISQAIDVTEESARVQIKPIVHKPAKKPKSRKNKGLPLSQEDIDRQEEEKQKELWDMLRKKIMQDEDSFKHKQFYPRISAAFVRTAADVAADEPERKTLQ